LLCVRVLLGSMIVIDKNIAITVTKSGPNSATLGIEASREISVDRPTPETQRALNREHLARREAKKRNENH
jgi:sRNA-binding carbon storage regulator CsrA